MIKLKVIIPRLMSGESEGEIKEMEINLKEFNKDEDGSFWFWGGKYKAVGGEDE